LLDKPSLKAGTQLLLGMSLAHQIPINLINKVYFPLFLKYNGRRIRTCLHKFSISHNFHVTSDGVMVQAYIHESVGACRI